ncbi:MAG: hypothetical protein AAB672_01675 [Patescibacteria group bacterium]
MNPEKQFYPLGVGGELEKQKETLSLYQVNNKVEYVNTHIQAPFELSEGTQTDLGIFLSPVPKQSEPTYGIEKQKYHGRAGLLGRVIIQDDEGRKYRDIDAKGVGYLSQKHIFEFSGTPGILNYEAATKEKDVSEAMLKLGLRASRVLSIIRLKEIFDKEGKRISIEEAKQKGLIRGTDEPVMEIRLMGTNARIQDITISNEDTTYTETQQKNVLRIEDAIIIVGQELGKKPEEFSLKDYEIWFAQNLGQQVALMHHNGWVHICLTDQNITLDGRIVDFATAEHYSEQKPNVEELLSKANWSGDILKAVHSLRKFCRQIYKNTLFTKLGDGIGLERLIEEFKKSYFDNLKLSEENRLRTEQSLEREIAWGSGKIW